MKAVKYPHLEEKILTLLRDRPRPAYAVAEVIGISKDEAFLVIRRLKDKNMAFYHNGRWHECAPPATKDTSVFPRPGYSTPSVGFFW